MCKIINQTIKTSILIALAFFIGLIAQHDCFAYFDVTRVKISTNQGRITETYKAPDTAPSGKHIIHIQDLHCNYEAQKNLALILEDLYKSYKVDTILVEGGTGDVSLAFLRQEGPKEVREKVAEKYLKKGLISGEEYLDIVSDYPLILRGIEDEDLYQKNIDAFFATEDIKARSLDYIYSLRGTANSLKRYVYGRELLEFDQKSALYHQDRMKMTDFISYLDNMAKIKSVSLRDYPNVSKIIELKNIESRIDFKKADIQRTQLVEELSQKAKKQDIEYLKKKAEQFKAGRVTQSDFYIYLEKLAKAQNINLRQYPELANYIRYISGSKDISAKELFNEIALLEQRLKDALTATPDQKSLEQISANVRLLADLIKLKLTPDEYARYRRNRGSVDIKAWEEFLKKKSAENNVTCVIPLGGQEFAQNIIKFETFYEVAVKRDDALINNAISIMNELGKEKAVLITGGFHTGKMTDKLKNDGFSFIIVAPKAASTPEQEKVYLEVMRYKESHKLEAADKLRAASTKNIAGQAGMLKDDIKNTSMKIGAVDPGMIDESKREWIQQGLAVKVWAKAKGARLPGDQEIAYEAGNEQYIEEAKKYLATRLGQCERELEELGSRQSVDAATRRVYLKGIIEFIQDYLSGPVHPFDSVDVVLVKGEDMLFFQDMDNHQPADSGIKRRTVWMGEGLFEEIKKNPRALAALLVHEIYHIQNPRDREIKAELAEYKIDPNGGASSKTGKNELRKTIDKVALKAKDRQGIGFITAQQPQYQELGQWVEGVIKLNNKTFQEGRWLSPPEIEARLSSQLKEKLKGLLQARQYHGFAKSQIAMFKKAGIGSRDYELMAEKISTAAGVLRIFMPTLGGEQLLWAGDSYSAGHIADGKLTISYELAMAVPKEELILAIMARLIASDLGYNQEQCYALQKALAPGLQSFIDAAAKADITNRANPKQREVKIAQVASNGNGTLKTVVFRDETEPPFKVAEQATSKRDASGKRFVFEDAGAAKKPAKATGRLSRKTFEDFDKEKRQKERRMEKARIIDTSICETLNLIAKDHMLVANDDVETKKVLINMNKLAKTNPAVVWARVNNLEQLAPQTTKKYIIVDRTDLVSPEQEKALAGKKIGDVEFIVVDPKKDGITAKTIFSNRSGLTIDNTRFLLSKNSIISPSGCLVERLDIDTFRELVNDLVANIDKPDTLKLFEELKEQTKTLEFV